MNHMKDVAGLFGKKLGEVFSVRDCKDENYYVARFTESGCEFYVERFHGWSKGAGILLDLILGNSEIVEAKK